MSVRMIGTGNISIKPQVDESLINEYIQFSKECLPEEYGEEKFSNTWFFDEENKLFSIAGKFAEPSIWYRHIKENFFEPRGYELEGEMVIIGECEPGFEDACKESEEKYREWKRRMYVDINLGKIIKEGVLADVPSIHRMTIDRQVERGKKYDFVQT